MLFLDGFSLSLVFASTVFVSKSAILYVPSSLDFIFTFPSSLILNCIDLAISWILSKDTFTVLLVNFSTSRYTASSEAL